MLSFPVRASVLFSAILLLAMFAGPGTTNAKPPGGGGGGNGGPDPPLDGTIFFFQSGSGIWATSPDGSSQQLVLPDGFDAFPSSLVYGTDPQLDRWWLRLEESGETYAHTVKSDGTPGPEDYPHVELYAYHVGPGAPGGFARVRVTSLFGEVGLLTTDSIRWSNDGDDTYISVFGNDISEAVTVDPVTGETTFDSRYRSGVNMFTLPVSGPALDTAVGLGTWTPVAVNDLSLVFEDMGSSQVVVQYDLAPNGTTIVQRGGPGLQIVPFDPAVPTVPLVEGSAYNPVWSRGLPESQIAYEQSAKIFVIGAGDPQVLLESSKYSYGLPQWSPDGMHLVVQRQFARPFRNNEYELDIVPANGGRAELITAEMPVNSYKVPLRWVPDTLAP